MQPSWHSRRSRAWRRAATLLLLLPLTLTSCQTVLPKPQLVQRGPPGPDLTDCTAEPVPARRWAPVEISVGGIPEVAPEWVALHGDEIRLIDVREPDELVGELGHIDGAEPLPLAQVPGQIGRASCREECSELCRSRWSPYH